MRATKAKRRRRRSVRGPKSHATLRSLLLRRRDELLAQLGNEIADIQTRGPSWGFNDVADRASDSLYNELAHGFAELASADLRLVERAIEKIDTGTYGRCESCGRPIPVARLRALPFAELCIDCKREEEIHDRLETG